MERSILDVHGSLQVTIPSELAAKYGWRAGDKVDFLDAGNGLNLALARERTVFTIGYEGQDVSHLTSALKKQGIKQLLDVREKPISRKPGFTKRRLKEALELAGIAYIHLPELGSPSAVRHDLKAGGTFEKFEKEYAKHLEAQEDVLKILEVLVQFRPSAVMCFEQDWKACHRATLVRVLETKGFKSLHL